MTGYRHIAYLALNVFDYINFRWNKWMLSVCLRSEVYVMAAQLNMTRSLKYIYYNLNLVALTNYFMFISIKLKIETKSIRNVLKAVKKTKMQQLYNHDYICC